MSKTDVLSWPPIRAKLLKWFDVQQRDLPWRREPEPYGVWVSEIMLQQTQVQTVLPYYERFLSRFPTPQSLAAADESEVLRLWEGLGYYRRARSLHAAAKQIVETHGGVFPTDYADVLALPGVGRYTAGAILSIADQQPLPILEGNTIRVHSRLAGIRGDVKSTGVQKRLWELAEAAVDPNRPGDLNQALMELGSEVCRPKQPDCEGCPVRVHCRARKEGVVERIPHSPKKIKFESRSEVAVLICRGKRMLLHRYGPGQRWAGLWDFPRFTHVPGEPDDLQSVGADVERLTGLQTELVDTQWEFKHAVTKYRITLRAYRACRVAGRLRREEGFEGRWVDLQELGELPLSVTGRRLVQDLDTLLVAG